MPHQHPVHALLDEVGDGALGLRAAVVHRHGSQVEELPAGFMLQHHCPDLGPVAVSDSQEIAAFDQIIKLFARLLDIGHLFLISAFLSAAKQGVPAKGDHCDFFHFQTVFLTISS